uniref:Nuclear autoantigenic sperm protein n=1 Tax=Oryzias latipes TaxID=8090 RepID=A0A3P9H9T9_ORYLA
MAGKVLNARFSPRSAHMEEANKLIGAGKKFLVMGKAVEAVSALQEACGMLAKQYGDTADECGEAFLWCGKALLDLARMENSVLGNALEGVPEEDEEEDKPKDSNIESTEGIDEETRDELRVQVYDAMAEKKDDEEEEKAGENRSEGAEKPEGQQPKADEGEEPNEDVGQEKSEVGKEADQEATAEQEEESAPKDKPEEESEEAVEDDEGEDEAEEQGDGAAEKDSEDEEVGNLQLAWEMLEVAKSIYKRKDTKEAQLLAAQAHLKLGEVSAESGNYPQALEDFQECLKLQVKHLEANSRLLAETHYQLGLTYSLNLQYSPAIEALNNSISVIKSRLEKLEELMKTAEGPEALPDERKEMEELKALLPEIQEKVEDATEGLKLVKAAVGGDQDGGSLVNGGASSSSVNGTLSNGGQTSAVPVSNISHLVRKKRKPEESPVKKNEVKKAKHDQNQEPAATGDSNGHVDEMEVAK